LTSKPVIILRLIYYSPIATLANVVIVYIVIPGIIIIKLIEEAIYLKITNRLCRSFKIMGIGFPDHIIVAEGGT